MIDLLDKTPLELADIVKSLGFPAFRAKQLFSWLHKGVDFSGMTNLPKSLLDRLKGDYVTTGVSVIKAVRSQKDSTQKLLFGLYDGNAVEGVIMEYHHGTTLCLSTQVGCAMGCAFCASTLEGRVRNLSAGEMIGQVVAAGKFSEVGNIVLMGSGEPFDNYEHTVKFLRLLNDPGGMNRAIRRVSVSTCGIVPQMRRFAEEGLSATLSVSLHAPNDEIRKQLMPVAKVYPINDVIEACRYYITKTGRRVIFEYALTDINSLPQHAAQLAKLLRGMQCHVNIIPLNPVSETGFMGVSGEQVKGFLNELERHNISATRRREMGTDIAGACGQLRRKHISESSEV